MRPLVRRILPLAVLLGAEALLASIFLDGASLSSKDGVLIGLVRDHGAWVVRGVIGFAALFTTFAYLKYKSALAEVADEAGRIPINVGWLATHFFALGLFGALSAELYGSGGFLPASDLLAAAWIVAALAAVVFSCLAFLPWALWARLRRATGNLWLLAFAAALAACLVGATSWMLWDPASKLTFTMVRWILRPFVADMVVEPGRMLIGTHRFKAIVSPQCSGLEGAALMLIFGAIWLFLFRHEIRFPQALALVPAGVLVLFLLNAVRIAVLIAIGNAGAREIAVRGFHSQAGWIAFNSVALGFSVVARRVPWISTRASVPAEAEQEDYPAAPYLLPLLAILAAGMISQAASGGFEWLYSLRLIAALGCFWAFRRKYAGLDWRFGWLGPAIGVLVFVLWIALDRFSGASHGDSRMPAALADASMGLRTLWIALRVLAAVVTVPLAEELAFRGFLLRRLVSADFEAVSFKTFTWLALFASSFVFGLLHGGRWLAGTIAGLLYALVSLRRGRLGEAVAAHATTNALLAVWVLTLQDWNLW